MDRIDAHHHLWRYTPAEYGWIDEPMAALRRDFGPEDLKREMDAAGIAGAVAVQARQTLEETRWLLDFAEKHDFLRGVVGWAGVSRVHGGVRRTREAEGAAARDPGREG
jgi:L-fuconolactonase